MLGTVFSKVVDLFTGSSGGGSLAVHLFVYNVFDLQLLYKTICKLRRMVVCLP